MQHMIEKWERERRGRVVSKIDEYLDQQRHLALEETKRARVAIPNAVLTGQTRPIRDPAPAPRHYCPPMLARDCERCNPALANQQGPVSRAMRQRAAERERLQREHEERGRQALQGLEPARPGSYEAYVEADASAVICEYESRGHTIDYGTALRVAEQRQRRRQPKEHAAYRANV
jgi:hypothetical protein